MAQLKFLFLLCFLIPGLTSSAQALTLKYLGQTSFEGSLSLGGLRLGGISQAQLKDNQIFAVSDDRGRFGGARLVIFDFDFDNPKWSQKLKWRRNLMIPQPSFSKIQDLETFHIFKDGRVLLSSEGDLNQKPRVHPFLNFWQEPKGWLEGVVFPSDFKSENIGLQTQGLQNNLAFESLAVSADESSFWVFTESSLFQSKNSEIQILEFQTSQLAVPTRRLSYIRNSYTGPLMEVFRGVSEVLWVGPDTFLVLERWLRLNKKLGRQFGADLFLLKIPSSVKGPLTEVNKQKILTLDGEFEGNWEGLNWIQKPGSPSILMITSDNNFETQVPTRFLFFETQN